MVAAGLRLRGVLRSEERRPGGSPCQEGGSADKAAARENGLILHGFSLVVFPSAREGMLGEGSFPPTVRSSFARVIQ